MNAVLNHLLHQGKIVTQKGAVMELVSIQVRNVKTQEESAMTISQVKHCEIYYSPEELEIQRLRKIIEDQHEHINLLMAKTIKPVKTGRGGYKHISRKEVKEAEEAFSKGVDVEVVANTYSISTQTARRIKDGTHPKSSIARKES